MDEARNTEQPLDYEKELDDLKEKINEAFKCPICLEPLYRPVIFPCQHNICSTPCYAVLKKISRTAHGTIDCPVCRTNSEISDIKDNTFLTNLVDYFDLNRVPEISESDYEKMSLQLEDFDDHRIFVHYEPHYARPRRNRFFRRRQRPFKRSQSLASLFENIRHASVLEHQNSLESTQQEEGGSTLVKKNRLSKVFEWIKNSHSRRHEHDD